jgi:glycosyltransferase
MSGERDTAQAEHAVPRPVRAGVSVVTVVRNGVATLERTIRSVLAQSHPDLEYVVVDGDSSDGTQELIRRYEGRLHWVSEPDQGLYDAMNKGLRLVADPERYVMFLNGDDVFAADDSLATLLAGSAGEDLLYGLLERHDEALGYRDVVGGELTRAGLRSGMIPHQTMLCRRRLFDVIGGFDLRYRIAADYDWLVRAFQRPEVTRRFVPIVVAVMARGGLSDRLYPRLLRERWTITRRCSSLPDVARYTAVVTLIEYPRYLAQRLLRRLGLLNWARDLRRPRRSSAAQLGAPPP